MTRQNRPKKAIDVITRLDTEVEMGMTGETMVTMESGEQKPINKVRRHDFVVDKNNRIKEVSSCRFMGRKPVWLVTTALNNARCCGDHKFLCRTGKVPWIPKNKPFFVKARDIPAQDDLYIKTNLPMEVFNRGDELIRRYRDEVWVKVVNAYQTEDIAPVFGICVEDSHSFYANGLAVHNCDEEVTVEESPHGYVLKARGLEIVCESLEVAYATYDRLKSYDDFYRN